MAPSLTAERIETPDVAASDHTMPKLKTHKGIKKRFKVSATGKVTHKKCGSSHLMSHKSGKQVRRLRKKVQLKVLAESQRIRRAVHQRVSVNPAEVAVEKAMIADLVATSLAEAAVDPATLPSEAP
jgi:large subunit ribosomal protein L35